MNVLFVSECDKRALTETRRVLDQFAERRGACVWQTPITQDGLSMVHQMLRKTARKNTAVACHWIRGLNHSELLWIVGDRARFSSQGTVPTNTTERNIVRAESERGWHTLATIRALVDLSSLLHDLGKSIASFQEKLRGRNTKRNLLRHEWISLRMWAAFVGDSDDAAWMQRLQTPSSADDATWCGARLLRDGLDSNVAEPFRCLALAPWAQAVGWLVLTHHRLPLYQVLEGNDIRHKIFHKHLADPLGFIGPEWNESHFLRREKEDPPQALRDYWTFPNGTPVASLAWRERAARAGKALARLVSAGTPAPLANPYVMHMARLCLMLGDHFYSSLQDPQKRVSIAQPLDLLWANTKKDGGRNQTLDEHLVGVAEHATQLASTLPSLREALPSLGRVAALTARAQDPRFAWQNRAFDLARSVQQATSVQGAFVVNMASTGCGKTLANARIMAALAGSTGFRCTFALGLRTLTLQTGAAFRERLQLDANHLAIRVGGAATKALFEYYAQQAADSGSESTQALVEEDTVIDYEGPTIDHPCLQKLGHDPAAQKLVTAPILVCTIDHIMPATESERGGRQIAPMLRLATSDLVLDEPDDFDLNDLPALTRLVHWAGLLGARVLLSSATLPPALIEGLFAAYSAGRLHYEQNRGLHPTATGVRIPCLWIDEFAQSTGSCGTREEFVASHTDFASRRGEKLLEARKAPRRLTYVEPLQRPLGIVGALSQQDAATAVAEVIRRVSSELHERHHEESDNGTRVSFGLVRMANISPIFDVARALFRASSLPNTQLHLCVYHSRHPLLVRSAIENMLDEVLRRTPPRSAISHEVVQRAINIRPAKNHIFLVLGSPVTEVGRDHDYDWAIAEPSSMRSLIQLAGRVRRHRGGVADSPNICVFSTNVKALRGKRPAYERPGFEDAAHPLVTHDILGLLLEDELRTLDALPRVLDARRGKGQSPPFGNLVDLEHARLAEQMLPRIVATNKTATRRPQPAPEPNAASWWQFPPSGPLLSAELQRSQRFRKSTLGEADEIALLPDDDGTSTRLHRLATIRKEEFFVPIEGHLCHRIADDDLFGDTLPWGPPDYLTLLHDLAAARQFRSLRACAERFGLVNVLHDDGGWRYHHTLGFDKAQTESKGDFD